MRLKKDRLHRMISNLKRLNQDISYHHFKINTPPSGLKVSDTSLLYGLKWPKRCILLNSNRRWTQEILTVHMESLTLAIWLYAKRVSTHPQKIYEATSKFTTTRPHFNIFSWWLPPDIRYRNRMFWKCKGYSATFSLSRFHNPFGQISLETN